MAEPNIVLFPQGLYLKRVRRNSDGTLKSGFVINGGWNFIMKYPAPPNTQEIVVEHDGDYNDVIEDAREKANDQATRNI